MAKDGGKHKGEPREARRCVAIPFGQQQKSTENLSIRPRTARTKSANFASEEITSTNQRNLK
jgi:hypothetical protein